MTVTVKPLVNITNCDCSQSSLIPSLPGNETMSTQLVHETACEFLM